MAVMRPRPKSLEKIAKNRLELKQKISEAKKEIRKIKYSINFKLNEEDQKHYDSWNEMIEKGNKKEKQIFIPYKDEKDYAIRSKQGQIRLYEHSLVKLICEEKGHKESVISTGTHGAFVNCRRCRTAYTRPMNVEESNRFTELMNIPITI